MVAEDNKKLISKYINGVSKRSLYRDINYDPNGIDYTHFLKLRLTTFDTKHNFIEQFTPEGFKILWYLMTRGKQGTYITTNLNTVIETLGMTRHRTIKAIQSLIDSNIIEVYSMKGNILNKPLKDVNTIVHILIKYHNDDLYSLDAEKGYRAIPFDFIHRAVLDLTEKEFTLLMFLMVRNRYYYISEYVNEDTGEISNNVNQVCYSFPTQEQISQKIKVNKNDVGEYTESLQTKGYIKIDKNREKRSAKNKITNHQEIKNMNYTYKVNLLNRMEYIKYHIVDIANEEMKGLSKELKKYINSTEVNDLLIECEGTNKLSLTIKNKLFLEQLYGCEIKEYYVEYKNKKEEEEVGA